MSDFLCLLPFLRHCNASSAGINVRDEFGRTPLHWSCEKGHTELATALVEAGADVRLQDACGRAPLEWATRAGDLPLVQFLVKNGATVKTVNSDGKTVLHLASHKGYTEVRLNCDPATTVCSGMFCSESCDLIFFSQICLIKSHFLFTDMPD